MFCSSSCRARARLDALRAHARRLLTGPLDPQWTIAVTAALGALLLGAVGLLLAELDEVSRSGRDLASGPEQAAIHAARLVETERGWEFEVEGPAGARVLVVDRSGRSLEITLDDRGRGCGPAASFGDSTVWITGIKLPAAPTSPAPAPGPTQPVAPGRPIPTCARILPTPAPTFPSPAATPQSVKFTPTVTRPASPPLATTPPREPAPPILHLVTDSGPRIAITFDGGASSNRTAELLDLLQDLDIKATLFLTGRFIKEQPALVRRAVLSGHEVGNHTYSHPHLTTYATDRIHRTLPEVTRERLLDELRRTETIFRRATGRSMAPLWRAPYGEENATLRRWAFEAGYLHVRWSSLGGRSLDTMDWIEDEHSPLYRDSRRIMDRLLRFPQLRGGIILMHLATEREEVPWTHLPQFVTALRERSIEPVRVTTLLAESRIWRGWLERAANRHAAAWDVAPEP